MSEEKPLLLPDVPPIPTALVEFSKELGALCQRYGVRTAETAVRLQRRYDTERDTRLFENQTARIEISTQDGRQRPRLQIWVNVDLAVRVPVVFQPDSTD